MTFVSINPATGETVGTFAAHSPREVENRLQLAFDTRRTWRLTAVAERSAIVARAGALLDERASEYARLMTLEMGKPLRAGGEEASKCAATCRYYAEHAERFLARELVAGAGADDYVTFEPLGVVLAVMPWNFPFWQVIRFAAPALVAGNVVLLKHASNVPQCALALETLFRDAGAAEGVFQTLLVSSRDVAAILRDSRVSAVTLTGSEQAGRAVGAIAGERIKRSVLELGGSDPFIVMPSADIPRAAATAARARVINNGQSCIAAKRFLVAEPVADEFERRFVHAIGQLRVGDPLLPETDVGPLATPAILEDIERQVSDSVRQGARVLIGGARLDRPGNYFAPTVLADVPLESPAAREELFGPVAALFRVADATAAITLANATAFGLGASAWTRDRAEADRFATELEAGSVFINSMVSSDPRFPFGGVKDSGYGRELGAYGLREFVNVKTVRMTFGAGMDSAATE